MNDVFINTAFAFLTGVILGLVIGAVVLVIRTNKKDSDNNE